MTARVDGSWRPGFETTRLPRPAWLKHAFLHNKDDAIRYCGIVFKRLR